jgi:hypothetical protein
MRARNARASIVIGAALATAACTGLLGDFQVGAKRDAGKAVSQGGRGGTSQGGAAGSTGAGAVGGSGAAGGLDGSAGIGGSAAAGGAGGSAAQGGAGGSAASGAGGSAAAGGTGGVSCLGSCDSIAGNWQLACSNTNLHASQLCTVSMTGCAMFVKCPADGSTQEYSGCLNAGSGGSQSASFDWLVDGTLMRCSATVELGSNSMTGECAPVASGVPCNLSGSYTP